MVEKIGLVWWRVSGSEQLTLSPETQIQEASKLAESEGYTIPPDFIFGTDWHSLSVWDSPPMNRVKELVRSGEVQGVFVYDSDRLPSKPAHRLLLRALLEESGAKLFCANGQPPDNSEYGEVFEFLQSWSKERQVLRAQQGSRDGLRDKAKIKGLPVTGIAPYGYTITYELSGKDRVPVCYEPDPAKYPVAVRIWREFLSGESLRKICRGLDGDDIPTARGGKWRTCTVVGMLRNPIYGGKVYSLRFFAKKGKTTSGRVLMSLCMSQPR